MKDVAPSLERRRAVDDLRRAAEVVEVAFEAVDDGVGLPVAADLAAAEEIGAVGGADAAFLHQRDVGRREMRSGADGGGEVRSAGSTTGVCADVAAAPVVGAGGGRRLDREIGRVGDEAARAAKRETAKAASWKPRRLGRCERTNVRRDERT